MSMYQTRCLLPAVRYNHTSADSWFDGNQWCVTSDSEGSCSVTQPLLLDTEKVACRYDTVIFPPKSTFLVGLETGADVYISSLILDGKVFIIML